MQGDSIMGSTTDKVTGVINRAIGKAKRGVGNAVGSDRLTAEGASQEAKGDVQRAVGTAKSALEDGGDKAAAALDRNL